MNMNTRTTEALIATLVDDLRPVSPLRAERAVALLGAGLAITILAVVGLEGLRADLAAMRLDPLFLIATGLFLLLGLAAAGTVIVMGRPRVGNETGGWRWAAAMTCLLPVVATIMLFDGAHPGFGSTVGMGIPCTMAGMLSGIVTASVLVLWLRRGAPTSPELASVLTGVAAGSLGVFAFSFHCPSVDIVHIGLWHSLSVALSALVCRVALPPLVRW